MKNSGSTFYSYPQNSGKTTYYGQPPMVMPIGASPYKAVGESQQKTAIQAQNHLLRLVAQKTKTVLNQPNNQSFMVKEHPAKTLATQGDSFSPLKKASSATTKKQLKAEEKPTVEDVQPKLVGSVNQKTTLLKKMQALWLPVTLVGVGGAGLGALGIHYVLPQVTKKTDTGKHTNAVKAQSTQEQAGSSTVVPTVKADKAGWEKAALARSKAATQATNAELATLQGLSTLELKSKVDASRTNILGDPGGFFQVGVLEGELLSRIPNIHTPINSPKIVPVICPEEIKTKFEPFSHMFSVPIAAIVEDTQPQFQAADATLSIKDATDAYSYGKKDRSTILKKLAGKALPKEYVETYKALGNSANNVNSANFLNPNLTNINEETELLAIFAHLYKDEGFYSEGARLKYLNEFLMNLKECTNSSNSSERAGVNNVLAGSIFGAGETRSFSKKTVDAFMKQYENFTASYQKTLDQIEKLPPSAYEDMVGLLHTMEQWNAEHLDDLILPDFQHGWNVLVSDDQFSLIDVCVEAKASMRQNFNYDHTTLVTQFGKVVFGLGCLKEGNGGPCNQPHNMLGMPINTTSCYPIELPEGQLSDLANHRKTATHFVENLVKACQKLDIAWDSAELKTWLKIR